jgi:hypothetical protein
MPNGFLPVPGSKEPAKVAPPALGHLSLGQLRGEVYCAWGTCTCCCL